MQSKREKSLKRNGKANTNSNNNKNSKRCENNNSKDNSSARSIFNKDSMVLSIGNIFLAFSIAIAAISYQTRLRLTPGIDDAAASLINIHDYKNMNAEEKIHSFLTWLNDNGATVSEHVTMAEFPEYGGYGLFAKSKSLSTLASSSSSPFPGQSHVLHALDEMFTIPANIIISTQSALEHFQTVQAQIPDKIRNLVQYHFHHSSMVQQDAIIATFLMQQCALGDKSRFKPYLDILPQQIIPRLDTFEEEHLTLLEDPYLAQVARDSKERLLKFYHDENFQFMLNTMARMQTKSEPPSTTNTITNIDADTDTLYTDDEGDSILISCGSFHSFHRFVSIVSSRAMVLYGQKYLTPFADLANYKPRSKERIDRGAVQVFALFHENINGSITVRADRDVYSGQQIFEDYGDLDNSLYLEAHGFVPDYNPFHCASIDGGKYLFDEIREAGLVDIMIRMGMLPPSDGTNMREYVPDLCIKQDGSVDNLHAIKYLTISALSREPKKLKRCVNAQTKASAELECLHYLGKTASWKKLVRQLARHAYCDGDDSLEQDEILLRSSIMGESHSIQSILALKFRIADKRILAHVGVIVFEQCTELRVTTPTSAIPDMAVKMIVANPSLTHDRKEEIQISIERFNAFIDSLHLPVCNIRASYIDDDIRVGVVATKDIQEGEIYLSMPPSSSILSSETATIGDNRLLSNNLLDALKSNHRDGGFDTLLFYLLHETYVAKKESKWHPYIQMLPSLDDLSRRSPLFFDEDMFDFLSGSDVRSILVANQQRAKEVYQEFTNNADIVKVLGLEHVSFDKFLWAYALIHSRSIWWDGMRHLVPMLDLVNCAELNAIGGEIAAAHKTKLDEGHNAVTHASTKFERGDQVLENYAQPNHIYFVYHGFVLEENTHDCILIESIGDHTNNGNVDSEVRRERLMKNGFRSFTPSFCIYDMLSLDNLANFIRIMSRLPGDNLGLGMDTIHLVKEELVRRLRLYNDIDDRFEKDEDLVYPIHAMRKIVNTEKQMLESLLKGIDSIIRTNHQ